jgi:hypothetical protein
MQIFRNALEGKNRRKVVSVVSAYVSMSLLVLVVQLVADLGQRLKPIWSIVWLSGPPGLLLYGFHYVVPYAVGSIVCVPIWCAATLATEVSTKIGISVFGLLAWAAFGLIIYAPWV